MQQLDKDRQKMEKDHEVPAAQTGLAQEETKDQGPKVTVKQFRFEGNSRFTNAQLAAVIQSYLDHPISYSQLEKAAAAIGEFYRQKGWTVRSFLPKQDIVDGVVTIQIIEAKFGKVEVEEGSYPWPSKKKIEATVAIQQHEGAALSTKKLERALLLLDDLPGAAVSGRLAQGKEEGHTDLVVKSTKEALFSGVTIWDNQGSRSTGTDRAQAFLQLRSPLGIGDQASTYVMYSEGLRFIRLEETVPVGNDGWRVGVNTSLVDYEVLPSEFESLDSHGLSSSIGAQATYPIYRTRQSNVYLNLNYDNKYFSNIAQEEKSSAYRINDYTIALRGNTTDQFLGGGNSYISVSYVRGNVSLGTVNSGEDNSIEGAFQKILFNISRQQKLMSKLFLYSALSGQLTQDKKLDSSEKFYLGGPSGVRAYPVSEGSGVKGHLSTTELRWRFLPSWQLSGFYDYGRVQNYGGIKSYSLQGAGVELTWQLKFGLSIKGTWAHRIGSNPNPTTSGNDQDGSLKKERFWLAIMWQF